MRILLTGANGYIGKRLLPLLIEKGHSVICMVRDPRRFDLPATIAAQVEIVQGDLLKPDQLLNLPADIDVAYYLVHSMGGNSQDFTLQEAEAANNFVNYLNTTSALQIIYLSGITNDKTLSEHLASRLYVEEVLAKADASITVLRAAIIIGSGSASFEIIRDLIDKLPLMITPKWLNSLCQPIAIRDVIFYLTEVLGNESCYGRRFEIGGPDVLTYRQMIERFAKIRHLKRYIIPVPFLSPRLSSYWLYFVTSVNYNLAKSLVDSLHNDAIVRDDSIKDIIPHRCLNYEEAIKLAYSKISQNLVVSSWKDALVSGTMHLNYMDFIQIPVHGVLTDKRRIKIDRPIDEVLQNIWRIGGKRGWYKTDYLWKIRGFIDKIIGGVGLRRGRRSDYDLRAGDTIDFWRVLLADKDNRRLILYAEMKLPGEAWLQFKITSEEDGDYLEQLAAFRPNGLIGRLYWYVLIPFHFIIFGGMIENIVSYTPQD